MCAWMYLCMYVERCTCIYVYMYICIHVFVYICICVYLHMYIVYIYVCMYVKTIVEGAAEGFRLQAPTTPFYAYATSLYELP